ncbi:MAG: protein TolQ [Bdellovibrionaceae bacterium]|nr:protein TolQ [Pseudobdellovibrionaceae bacterium]
MNFAYAAPVQSQAATQTQAAVEWGIWSAVWNASPIVQLTLLGLIFLSVLCWAVAISKFQQIRRMTEGNEAFLKRFWKANSLDELNADAEDMAKISTVARVFKAGFGELQKLANNKSGGVSSHLSGSDNLERALRKASGQEISAMESRLTILATTGSTGPFVGLFGTVWGIMNSFHKIGASGSASLAVVAPGISEALFATAIGLIAAIPAVVLYNHFVAQIRREEEELANFSTDFLNIAKRNFFKD